MTLKTKTLETVVDLVSLMFGQCDLDNLELLRIPREKVKETSDGTNQKTCMEIGRASCRERVFNPV
jgi:hypothetical protein